jgi:hypothetical protein
VLSAVDYPTQGRCPSAGGGSVLASVLGKE